MRNLISGWLIRPVFGFISCFKSAFFPGAPERAGEVLAALALGKVVPAPGRIYAFLVKSELTFPDPSEFARSDEARDRLWRESVVMVVIRLAILTGGQTVCRITLSARSPLAARCSRRWRLRDVSDFADADLIVAADGANSIARSKYAGEFD